MNKDITYCTNTQCHIKCSRSPTNLKNIKDKSIKVNCADFSGVCRKWIKYLLCQYKKENE